MNRRRRERGEIYDKWDDEFVRMCRAITPRIRKELLRRMESEGIDVVSFYMIVKREVQKYLDIFDWGDESSVVREHERGEKGMYKRQILLEEVNHYLKKTKNIEADEIGLDDNTDVKAVDKFLSGIYRAMVDLHFTVTGRDPVVRTELLEGEE